MKPSDQSILIPALALLCVASFGCGEIPDRVPVTRTRTATVAPKPALPSPSSDQRFGAGGGPSGGRETPPIEWDDPPGWTPAAPTDMRLVNYTVGEATECYVTLLPGRAGGVLDNINRWRRQMGYEPMTEADVLELPRLRLFDQPAPFVSLEGTFSGGMGDPTPRDGYRLLGTLLGTPRGAIFVKMVGPGDEVVAQRAAFEAFCLSLRTPGTADAVAKANADATSAGIGPDGGSGNYKWSAPDSWDQEPPRMMRVVSFRVGPAGEGECYISVLGGGAGGVENNVNRWRSEVGLGPATAKELAELNTLQVLGREATLFEATGAFQGMTDTEARDGTSILGLICELDTEVVFVKLVAPEAVAAGERENFIEFCQSLGRG